MRLLLLTLWIWVAAALMGVVVCCQMAFMAAEYHPYRWIYVPYTICFMTSMFCAIISLVRMSETAVKESAPWVS